MDPITTTIALSSLLSLGAPSSTRITGWSIKPIIAEENISATERLVAEKPAAYHATDFLFLKPKIDITIDARWSIIRKIQSWEFLAEGWDGDDSVPPRKEDVSLATKLIDLLPSGLPLPSPMMSSKGLIGLYWSLPDRYVDVEFDGGSYSVYYRLKDSNAEDLIDGLMLSRPDLEKLGAALGSDMGLSQQAA